MAYHQISRRLGAKKTTACPRGFTEAFSVYLSKWPHKNDRNMHIRNPVKFFIANHLISFCSVLVQNRRCFFAMKIDLNETVTSWWSAVKRVLPSWSVSLISGMLKRSWVGSKSQKHSHHTARMQKGIRPPVQSTAASVHSPRRRVSWKVLGSQANHLTVHKAWKILTELNNELSIQTKTNEWKACLRWLNGTPEHWWRF